LSSSSSSSSVSVSASSSRQSDNNNDDGDKARKKKANNNNDSNSNNRKRSSNNNDGIDEPMKKKVRLVSHSTPSSSVAASLLSPSSSTARSSNYTNINSNSKGGDYVGGGSGGDDGDDDESWTEGSWCWLLPNNSPTPTITKNKSTRTLRTRCCRKQTPTATMTTKNVINGRHNESWNKKIRQSENNNNNDDSNKARKRKAINNNSNNRKRLSNNNDGSDDGPMKKKIRLVSHSTPSSSVVALSSLPLLSSDIRRSNYTNNDNSGVGGGSDDDEGYESWTEGNWCWILPTTTTTTTNPGTTKNKTTSTMRSVRRCCRYTRSTMKTPQKEGIHNNKSSWNKMFQRLVAYKEKHHTTNVPYRCKKDPQLGEWVANQRRNYREETVSKHRVDLLNSIHFVWGNLYEAQWMEMYQRLLLYKTQHNYDSTSVPRCYKEDPELATWVTNQQRYYGKKRLSVERINYLDSIGFVLNYYDKGTSNSWIEMYGRLVAYKKKSSSGLYAGAM